MALVVTFRGVDAKLRRADEHLKSIENHISKVVTTDPDRFVSQYDQRRGKVITRPHPSLFVDRDYWASIAGDFVHNLRSTLDHMAHQLLILQGGTPRLGRGGTAFPILDTKVGPRGGPRQVHISGDVGTCGGEVLAYVESLQPYHRGNAAHSDPLWVLSELDNMDKHRTLAMTVTAMTGFRVAIVSGGDISLHFDTVGYVGPLYENTELACWQVAVIGPNPHVEVEVSGQLHETFDVPCINAGHSVVPALTHLRDYVKDVLDVLQEKGLRTRTI